MKITYVSLQNFRSFLSQEGVGLSHPPGLYFMTGENQVEPELEANGSGKSSFWEAICWALYGKTSRNLRAGDIGTWDIGKGTVVELGVEFEAGFSVLRRGWNPNSLTLDGKDITQAGLEELVGLTQQAFLHSVFMSQFSPTFLDLSATDKANLLSEVLDLDQWLTLSDKAGAESKKLSSLMATHRSAIDKLEGRWETLLESDFETAARQWEDHREAQIEALEKVIAEFGPHLDNIHTSLKLAEEASFTARKGFDVYKSDLEAQRRTVDHFQYEVNFLQGDKRVEEAKLAAAKVQRDKVKSGICSSCGQEIDDEHVARQTKKFGIATIEENIAAIDEEIVKARARKAAADAKLTELVKASESLRIEDDRRQKAEWALREQFNRSQAELRNRQAMLKQLSDSVNPHLVQIREREEDMVAVGDQIKITQDEIVKSSDAYEHTHYWVKGFKDLRLFLISEALMQLEVQVNAALMQLGLMDWSMTFAIDSENKTGGTRRGFSVLVNAPHSDGPVPWEAWSGGESQRLRLAGQLGLSSLIMEFSGASCNLEVWDEPSTWMSSKGINDLLDTLSSRAQSLGKSVWVVDHRALEYGGFTKVLKVVKTVQGSKVGAPRTLA